MMNDELRLYLRSHPKWYIILNREPQLLKELMEEYKEASNQSLTSKLDKLSMALKLIEMMM